MQLPNRADAYAGGFHDSIDSNFTVCTDRIGVRVLVMPIRVLREQTMIMDATPTLPASWSSRRRLTESGRASCRPGGSASMTETIEARSSMAMLKREAIGLSKDSFGHQQGAVIQLLHHRDCSWVVFESVGSLCAIGEW
jgi:hypothetical protein